MKTLVQVQLTAFPAGVARVEVEPLAGFAGDDVTVRCFDVPPGVKNWVAEVPRGLLWQPPMRWQYLPDGQAQAMLVFAGLGQGEWEYLLYLNDSVRPQDIVARSAVVVMAALANRNPIWPSELVEFIDGVPAVRNLKIAFDPDGDPLTFGVVAPFSVETLRSTLVALGKDPGLADGFSFDEATLDLSYDGRSFGTDAATPSVGPLGTGLRLSADDGRS